MASDLSSLDGLRVASPCKVSWEAMRGTDRVRFCSLCSLNVYDLSAMSRDEAEALVRATEGRLCVRFYRRADGTVLTQDCPKGTRAVTSRVRRVAAAILVAIIAVVARACQKEEGHLMGTMAVPAPQRDQDGLLIPTMGETRPESR